MRGNISIRIVDDNSMIITIAPEGAPIKTATCAPKDYVKLCETIETQVKQFQKQPVVDITKG